MVESDYITGDNGKPVLIAPRRNEGTETIEGEGGLDGADEYTWWASDWQPMIAEIDGIPQNTFQSSYPDAIKYDPVDDTLYVKSDWIMMKIDRDGTVLEYNDGLSQGSQVINTLTIGHGDHEYVFTCGEKDVYAYNKSDLSLAWSATPTPPESGLDMYSLVYTSYGDLFVLWQSDTYIQKIDPSGGSAMGNIDISHIEEDYDKILANSNGYPVLPGICVDKNVSNIIWERDVNYEYSVLGYTIGQDDKIYAISFDNPNPYNFGRLERISSRSGNVEASSDIISEESDNGTDNIVATPSYIIVANNVTPANWSGDGGTARINPDLSMNFSNYIGAIEYMATETGEFSTWNHVGDWSAGGNMGIAVADASPIRSEETPDPPHIIIDSFEDNDLSEYDTSNDGGYFSIVTEPTWDGDYALQLQLNYNDAGYGITSTSGLPHYPTKGETFSIYYRADGTSGDKCNFEWNIVNTDTKYHIDVNQSNGGPNYEKAEIARSIDGNRNTVVGESNGVWNATQDEWYRIEVQWNQDDTFTLTVYNANGNIVQGPTSGSDNSPLTETDGIRWVIGVAGEYGDDTSNVYFDYAKQEI